MSSLDSNHVDSVQTLTALIPADQLGATLPHEHLIVQGWDYQAPNYMNSAYMELVKFTAVGGRTVVDLSAVGLPRDPNFACELATRSGIQVVMGTGFYKDAWQSDDVRRQSVDELANFMVTEITKGMAGTNLRAGVIGEIGISRPRTEFEGRVLAAAAQAQQRTGAGINLHFELYATIAEAGAALDLLEGAGADLTHVAVSHVISRPDLLQYARYVAGRGCFIEFDLFGQERRLLMDDLIHTHPDVQMSSIKGFIHWGLLNHMLLSLDVRHVDLMTVNGGDGYSHLFKNVIPRIRSYGVSDEEIKTLIIKNPQRFLTLRPSMPTAS